MRPLPSTGSDQMKTASSAVRKVQFQVITGGKFRQTSDWGDRPCRLTMYDLVSFQDRIRSLTIWITGLLFNCPSLADYRDVVSQVWRELHAASAPYAELLYWPEDQKDARDERFLASLNLGHILPTAENLEMLERFRKLFEDREEQLRGSKERPTG
jgi:hypothetical protein